jgi:hypothetical protein
VGECLSLSMHLLARPALTTHSAPSCIDRAQRILLSVQKMCLAIRKPNTLATFAFLCPDCMSKHLRVLNSFSRVFRRCALTQLQAHPCHPAPAFTVLNSFSRVFRRCALTQLQAQPCHPAPAFTVLRLILSSVQEMRTHSIASPAMSSGTCLHHAELILSSVQELHSLDCKLSPVIRHLPSPC